MSPPLALGELLDLLRSEGFAIGVDDHLRVNRLLALDVTWDEEQLRSAVRAVIAKDRRERASFDAVWLRLFVSQQPVESQIDPPPAGPARRSRRPSARRLLVMLQVGLLGGLGAGVVAAVLIRSQPPSREPATPDAGIASGASTPVAPIEAPEAPEANQLDAGSSKSAATAPIGATNETPQNGPQPKAVESSVVWHGYRSFVALLAGGALVVGGLAISRRRSRRRRQFIPGPWRYMLHVPDATLPIFARSDVADGAAHLTWRLDQEVSGDLDIERSAHATASGGVPAIVYRLPPRAPRYLVLEDTEGGSERWRFLYDELLHGLMSEGVDLTRYTFAGDPSVCMGDERVCCELRDLVDHYDALIVIGDGDAAFDPIEGRPAEWLQTLRRVPSRLWLNPLPKARWSRGAWAIARDTPMAHAVVSGLAALKTGVERSDAVAPGCPWIIERAPGTSPGFAALQDHLGPVGMRAIASVAMVGAPSIALVRWLVERFQLELDEAAWLRVVALPWFRLATWPEGLQERLVTWLQASDTKLAGEVSSAATTLLVADEPPPGSSAHLRWELELAAAGVRAGDRASASAVVQKIGATALYREVPRKIPGASPDRTNWRIGVSVLLGIALCVLAGIRLELPGGAPATPPAEPPAEPPANPLPTVGAVANDGAVEALYTIKPPDPKDPRTQGDAPQIEVTIVGAPNLPADQFLLVDKSAKPEVKMNAIAKRSFSQGAETLAVAIVMLGWEQWIGNSTYRSEQDPARERGVLIDLQAALDKLDFKDAGPRGSLGTVITYADTAVIRVPMGPLGNLSGNALGAQKDYKGTKGYELVKGVELALAVLRKVQNPRKVLIVITDGNDTNNDTAKARLVKLKQQAKSDKVQTFAIVYKAADSEPNNVIIHMIERTTIVTRPENIATAIESILVRMADRQYLTFPGYDKETGIGFQWDSKPHALVIAIGSEETTPVSVLMAPTWKLFAKKGL